MTTQYWVRVHLHGSDYEKTVHFESMTAREAWIIAMTPYSTVLDRGVSRAD